MSDEHVNFPTFIFEYIHIDTQNSKHKKWRGNYQLQGQDSK